MHRFVQRVDALVLARCDYYAPARTTSRAIKIFSLRDYARNNIAILRSNVATLSENRSGVPAKNKKLDVISSKSS